MPQEGEPLPTEDVLEVTEKACAKHEPIPQEVDMPSNEDIPEVTEEGCTNNMATPEEVNTVMSSTGPVAIGEHSCSSEPMEVSEQQVALSSLAEGGSFEK